MRQTYAVGEIFDKVIDDKIARLELAVEPIPRTLQISRLRMKRSECL